MPAEAIELFYVYSRKDDALRKQLDTHLSTLKREDLIDAEYIVKLVKKVVTVSVKTVELVEELAQSVTQEDWLGSALDTENKDEYGSGIY